MNRSLFLRLAKASCTPTVQVVDVKRLFAQDL